jgi:hypothetical protein
VRVSIALAPLASPEPARAVGPTFEQEKISTTLIA